MSIKLDEFHLVLDSVLSDFSAIQRSGKPPEEKLRVFAESLQRHSDICYVMVKMIENESMIFDSVFTQSKERLEVFMEKAPKKWELASHKGNALVVSSGKVIWYSLEEKPHPFFMGAILPAVSWVLIPVKKSDNVIGIIEIGSEEIVDPQTRNDPLLFSQLVEPFEILATKISQTFETKS